MACTSRMWPVVAFAGSLTNVSRSPSVRQASGALRHNKIRRIWVRLIDLRCRWRAFLRQSSSNDAVSRRRLDGQRAHNDNPSFHSSHGLSKCLAAAIHPSIFAPARKHGPRRTLTHEVADELTAYPANAVSSPFRPPSSQSPPLISASTSPLSNSLSLLRPLICVVKNPSAYSLSC